MKRVLSLLTLLLLAWNVSGQQFDLPCDNYDYKATVKTVLLYADGNQNKEPSGLDQLPPPPPEIQIL